MQGPVFIGAAIHDPFVFLFFLWSRALLFSKHIRCDKKKLLSVTQAGPLQTNKPANKQPQRRFAIWMNVKVQKLTLLCINWQYVCELMKSKTSWGEIAGGEKVL